MQAYDKQRENIIKSTRDVLKNSKQAIFALHRGDRDKAVSLLDEAEAKARALLPLVQEERTLRQGSFANACEEYVEARAYQHYLEHGTLITMAALGFVDRDEYLGGVIDLTGELMRYAVARATERDTASVRRCADLVDAIQGCLIQFEFRNGSLRKKYDAVKWNMKKLETVLYELSLVSAGKVTAPSGELDEKPMDDKTEG